MVVTMAVTIKSKLDKNIFRSKLIEDRDLV